MASQIESDEEDEPTAQINIVPFVDIVLVVLIIFILTSKIIARASFPVDVPRAANAGQTTDATANIVVTIGGELFLDGNPVSPEALAAGLHEKAARDPKLRAVISADKGLRYEQVIAVIDAVKGAGVAAFALNVERAARSGP